MQNLGLSSDSSKMTPAFQAVSKETAIYREKITKRHGELRSRLESVRAEIGKYSILGKTSKELDGVQQVLKRSPSAFTQVHCGRTAKGTRYEEKNEGHPVQRAPVQLMNSALKLIEADKDNSLSLTNRKTLDTVLQGSNQLVVTVARQTELAKLNEDDLRIGVTQFATETAQALDKLSKGQDFTLPVGAPGSGMFLRFAREEGEPKKFTLFLYNASDSAMTKQGGVKKGVTPTTQPFYVFESVPAEMLYYIEDKELRSPLFTELIALTVRDVQKTNDLHVLRFLEPLQKYQGLPQKHINLFIRCQRANFSSHKALNALQLHLLQKDYPAYKRLTMDVRLITLVAEYQLHKDTLSDVDNAPLRSQIRISAQNLLKSVYKYSLQDSILSENEAKRLIATALDVIDAVEKAGQIAHSQQTSNTKATLPAENKATITLAAETAKKFTHPSISAETKPRLENYVNPPQAPKNPEQLFTSLNKLNEFLANSSSTFDQKLWEGSGEWQEVKLLNSDAMTALQNFMAQLPEPGDKFWDAIPAEDTIKCLTLLGAVNQKYGQTIAHKFGGMHVSAFRATKATIYDRACSSVQQLTLFNLYANIHRMTMKADKESGNPVLTGYNIDVTRFRDAMDLDPTHTYGSYRLLERRRAVEDYFSKTRANSEQSNLFHWNIDQLKTEPSGADKQLYESLLQHPKVKERSESKEFKECIERWARANPIRAAVAGESGMAHIEHEKKLCFLQLDMGTSEFRGYKRNYLGYPDYKEEIGSSNMAHVEFKEGTNPFLSHFDLQSILSESFPYIGILKQSSIAAAVLLDVNSIKSEIPVNVTDLNGRFIPPKENSGSGDFLTRAKFLMRERQLICQDGQYEAKIHLGAYGRALSPSDGIRKNKEVKEKKIGDRLFTGAQLSTDGKNAAFRLEDTGTLEARSDRHQAQNSILAKAGSKSTEKTNQTPETWDLVEQGSSSNVSDHNIIQWMRDHPLSLKDSITRAELMILLYRPQHTGNYGALSIPILNSLKEYPDHILPQIRNLVAEGITRYYRGQPLKRAEVEPLVFILNLAQQINRNYFEIYGEDISPPLYNTDLFDQLMALSENAEPFTEKELMLLRISQFTHLFPHAAPEKTTDNELQNAALGFIRLIDAGIEFKSQEIGEQVIEQLKEGSNQILGEYLRRSNDKTFANAFAANLSKELKLPCQLTISDNRSLIFVGFDPQGMKWELNLKTGDIRRNGKPTKLGGLRPSKDIFPLWDHLFGDRKHTFRSDGGFNADLDFTDPLYGKMRFLVNAKSLQREFANKWFTAIKPDDTVLKDLVPSSLRVGYSHWIAEKPDNGGISLLVCDRNSGIPVFAQNTDGVFQTIKSLKNWDGKASSLLNQENQCVIRFPAYSSFSRLLSSYIGFTDSKDTTEASQVLFPQISSPNGEPVRFDRRDGRWVYAADPSFAIAEPQLNNLFVHHNDYLVLEKIGRPSERQLLIIQPPLPLGKLKSNAFDSTIQLEIPAINPWSTQKIQTQVSAFPLVDGELQAENVDDKLYLAWQYLTGKDYSSANKLIRSLGAGDKLSVKGSLIIQAISNSAEDANDFSSEACAVRLRALWIAKILDPNFETPTNMKEIFADYLQGLERMPIDLVLCARELEDLHQLNQLALIPRETIEWEMQATQNTKSTHDYWNKKDSLKIPHILNERPPASTNPNDNRRYSEDIKLTTLLVQERDTPSQLPIFGEKQITVNQFYVLYDALNDPNVTKTKKEEIGYRLFHCSTVEGFNEKSDALTIGRLNILYTLYQKGPSVLPPLPQDKTNIEDWWPWWTELTKKLGNTVFRHMNSPPPLAGRIESGLAVNENKVKEEVAATQVKKESSIVLKGELPQLQIDLGLKKLTETHFNAGVTQKPSTTLDPLTIPNSLTDKDKKYTQAIEKEFATYNRDVETARNEALAQIAYKLKSHTDGKQLKEDMAALIDQKNGLESELLKQEEGIIFFLMKPRAAKTRADLEAFARQETPMILKPTMLDIARACVKGTNEAYRTLNPYLTDNEIQEIHHQTLEFMLGKTSLQQVKAAHDFLSKWEESQNIEEAKAYFDQALSTLTAPRNYPHGSWKEIQENVYNLYFEYKTEMRVMPKQYDLLTRIMHGMKDGINNETLSNVVFQLMMGGGKTSVILSVLLDLISEQPNRLAVLVLHPSQFDAVLGNLQKYQKDRFQKELIPIDYTREQLHDIKKVNRLYEILLLAKKDHNGIAMQSTMPQIILLELRKIAADLRDKKITPTDQAEQILRASLLGKILKLFSEEGVFLTDEVDMVLNIVQQLTFPVGEKQHLPPERIRLTSELFLAIEKENLMKFGPDTQPVSKQEYERKFLHPLSLASCNERNVPAEHKNAYLRYARNEIDGTLEEYALGSKNSEVIPANMSHEEKENIAYLRYLHGSEIDPKEAGLQALSRFMVSTIMPQILSLESDRHIGYHPSGNGKVIPFLGRKNPATTELANPDEAVAAGALCALTLGIPRKAIVELAEVMAKAAEGHAIAYDDFDNTPEAKIFLDIAGISLDRARHGKDLDKVEEHLRKNSAHALQMQANLDQIHVTYYKDFLTSEAYDIPSLARANVACSGTLQTKDTFERIRNAMLDEGTEGKILEILRTQGKDRPVLILGSEGSATNNFLQLIDKEDNNTSRTGKVGALIDAGGILKGVTGQEFAREYLKHYKDNNDRLSVVFFHRYIDQNGRQQTGFAVLRRNPETQEIDKYPILIKDTTPDSLKRVNVNVNNMFVFFEESKTTGVDFKLNATCRGLLTFNPQNQTFRKVAQGALRMRQVWYGQEIEHVIPQSQLDYYENKIPSVDQLLQTSLVNQATEKSQLVTRSYRERIRHVAIKTAQQGLIEAAALSTPEDFKQFSEFVDKVNGYGKYLDTTFQDNLLQQFGRLSKSINAIKHLEEVQKREEDDFPNKDLNLKEKVAKAQKALLEEAKQIAGAGYLAENMDAPSHFPSFGTQVQIAVEAQQQTQQEQQQEQQIQVEQQIQRELDFYQSKETHKEVKEQEWTNLDNLHRGLPGSDQGVMTFSVHDYLERNKSCYYQGHNFATIFAAESNPEAGHIPLYFSDNFVKSVQVSENFNGLSLFHRAHKKISHLLVTVNASGNPELLALSNQDFEIFRRKINNWMSQGLDKPYWIVNLKGELAAGKGMLVDGVAQEFGDRITENAKFQNVLLQANFINGNLRYLEKNPEQTRKMMLAGGAKYTEERRNFLKLRAGHDQIMLKQLNSSECLNPLGEKARTNDLKFQVSEKHSKPRSQAITKQMRFPKTPLTRATMDIESEFKVTYGVSKETLEERAVTQKATMDVESEFSVTSLASKETLEENVFTQKATMDVESESRLTSLVSKETLEENVVTHKATMDIESESNVTSAVSKEILEENVVTEKATMDIESESSVTSAVSKEPLEKSAVTQKATMDLEFESSVTSAVTKETLEESVVIEKATMDLESETRVTSLISKETLEENTSAETPSLNSTEPAGVSSKTVPKPATPIKASRAGTFFKGLGQMILSGLLSIGISQIFGLAKGTIDLGRKLNMYIRMKKIENLQSRINNSTTQASSLNLNEFKKLKSDTNYFFKTDTISDLFKDAIDEETQKSALSSLSGRMAQVKNETEQEILAINLALKADAAALIPLAGAGLYWKITHKNQQK
jgi:hypothetical protein